MKKKNALIAMIGLLIIVATITNPTKNDFIAWSKEKLISESSNRLANWGIETLGGDLIASATTTNNLVLLSIFTVNLSETEKVKVMGIFNNFIALSGASKEKESTYTTKSSKESFTNSDFDKNNTMFSMLNFKNEKPIKNVESYTYEEEDKELPIKLKDGKTSIYFGKDHPNGIKIQLIKGGKAARIELEEVEDEILDDFGDLADINNYSIQVGTHDFNNDDIEEIIIAIGDNLITGQVWVYSYHNVDDILKINPFHMEMTGLYQDKIWIDKDKIILPYGSQGLFEEYVWHEDGFLHR